MKKIAIFAFAVVAATAAVASTDIFYDNAGMTDLVTNLLNEPTYSNTDIKCLTDNVYHEARGETKTGQRAVVEVVMRRLEDTRWGDSICEVVYYPYAFSWTIGERPIVKDIALWDEIRADVIKYLNDPLEWNANHYHADYILPYWAEHMDYVAHIGGHIFYTDRS